MSEQSSWNRRRLLQAGAMASIASLAPRAMANERPGWRDGPSLPLPVQEIYPCLHDGRIHVAGGFVAESGRITGPTAAHHRLDVASGAWQAGPSLPVARHHPQLASFSGSLYCIGGFESHQAGAWQMKRDVWRLAGNEEGWVAGPEMPAPNGESVTGILGRNLHVVGGRQPASDRNLDWNDHADTGAHWVFDGTSWSDAAPLPTPRNSAAGVVADGRLHVVGGRTVSGGNTPAHEVYDHWSDRWERLAPMPKAQGGLAAGVVGDRLYAFGGEYFNNGGGVYREAWEYDTLEDRWRAIADMPTPRHGLGGVSIGPDVYLIGGARRRGGDQTSAAVEIYRP